MIGVIGGSGVYEIDGVVIKEEKRISTPFGEPSDSYRIGEISGVEVAFLPRHGSPHHIAPHKINYRANIRGFRELGAERIISVNAVGGINPKLKPGSIVILNQIIDMTEGRESTFYDEEEIVHVDFTEPYCPELRTAILTAGKNAGVALKENAVYVCVNGPRLETAAEIKAFSLLGADVVGMTGMPEASLARELAICFSGIGVVTNFAAGISGNRLTTTEVVSTMAESAEAVKALLERTFISIPHTRNCGCKDALANAKM
ncbi:MAG: methylthioadenosine phosphorylase [Nitrospirae bacterium GWF2_44_13]|nr:MAG: methylthioadenosine phosphorylase [Nitrospirae bacterium GWF2_44_13]OGW65578.1 MAG: methylthioadenosine phosphorylase [Nitrospirae bacterium RIFOXYA2_FULL_44_9]